MANEKEPDSHFTVFIRLPFPRGDFIDPPPVDWDASKDRALWDVLSRPSKGHDIDWKALADSFDVTLSFLLQQAAWLYERQLSQVRAQMRKVGTTTHSTSQSPTPGSVAGSAVGGQAMRRAGSGGSRVPSRLSVRGKDTGMRTEGSAPGTPVKPKGRAPPNLHTIKISTNRSTPSAPPMSRTASNNTAVHSRHIIAPRNSASPHTKQPSRESHLRQSYQAPEHPKPEPPKSPATDRSPSSSSVSESDSAEDSEPPKTRPQQFKRATRFSSTRPASKPMNTDSLRSADDDDDEDETPAFLPYAHSKRADPTPYNDPSATLLLAPSRPSTHRRQQSAPNPSTHPPGTASSTSSGSSVVVAQTAPTAQQESTRPNRVPTAGPMSSHRQAELAKLSPRRRAAAGKDGSDGTPSMGSSFSDLDDASVTQSALEEALLSNMQHGGVASRMSSISQALRSRYL